MKTWLRWILIVTQVGGGFTGLVASLAYLQDTENLPFAGPVFTLAFAALYTFIGVAGVLFALDERRTGLTRLGLWAQIPWISSPLISWQFAAGLCVVPSLSQEGPNAVFWLGSLWQFSLFTELPWEIGINLFPVLMLFLLARAGHSRSGVRLQPWQEGDLPAGIGPQQPASMDERPLAAQVNAILQARLVDTPLAERGVRLQSRQDGGASVMVGACQYASVDEVPEENIRLAIRSAIAEWESRGPA